MALQLVGIDPGTDGNDCPTVSEAVPDHREVVMRFPVRMAHSSRRWSVPAEVPPFADLIAGTQRSAVHLEMRDAYSPADPSFISWQGGLSYDRTQREADWHALIGGARARSVVVRRARIISEPVTPYIRFEYDVTDSMNIAAGEQVRWLPRRRASDLALPGNDFWVFDGRLVRFGHFAGDGTVIGHEMSDDPAVAKLCATAFEAVWSRATGHEDYRPT